MGTVRIKDHWAEQRLFERRALAAAIIIVVLTLTLIGRLVVLQVMRYEYYAELSQGNRVRLEPLPAPRGLILDRNGTVLAENRPAFQLELVRERVPDVDATLKGLIDIGVLSADDLEETRRLARSRRSFESVPIRLRLTPEEIARFAEHRFDFPGVDIATRLTRFYPHGEHAVHAIGYVAAISESDVKRLDEEDQLSKYAGTTLIGKLGIEASYEKELHGTDGSRQILVNAAGRSVQQRQSNLAPDLQENKPEAGVDVITSIDLPTQLVAEQGLIDHRGAVVAIDPNNGDVIALASMPGFDPNPFGRGLTKAEYAALADDIDVPLLNRALRGQYPSGSTIKPGLALAGLVYHDVDPNATKFCPGIWHLPGSSLAFREGRTGRHGAVDLRHAIAKSCDVYFYGLANDIGVDHIAEFLGPLGFGSLTGIDIGGEKPGLLPSKEWKRKTFKRPADQVWFPGETVNFGVGQGYFLVTPLQLAHYVSIIANRGTSYKPRLVSGVRDPATGEVKRFPAAKIEEIKNVSAEQWQIVTEGMAGTLRYGTAAAFAGKNMTYTIAGKTGTAQVFTVARSQSLDNQKTVSDRLRDHSWFIAFAPAEHPRIAVAVIVENGGFGASIASPIARNVMDTYLLDANGQLKVPLPPGTVPLTPGPGYGPIIPGKGAAPTAAAPPKEDTPATEAED
ncbi:MAG TPA: penicillin-binding protein 2 [Steroidobacteraceae bacterium]|nr:penicillin-binding protein 2 [Steroidobacteraceae bacterium]